MKSFNLIFSQLKEFLLDNKQDPKQLLTSNMNF